MQANRFDGSPSTLFLTLFIFYHCTDTGIGGDNVASEVLYMPDSGLATCSLFKIVFMSRAIKKLLEAINV